MKGTITSWKTTAAACCAAVGAIMAALAAQWDGDPTTTPEWGIVVPMVIAAIGLLFARDSDK
jgi:hypothetical protein